MWLMAYDKILINWSRGQRNIASSSCCNRCSAEKEDALHAVRDCKESKEVWTCFIRPLPQRGFFSQNLQEWLLTSLAFRGDSVHSSSWLEAMAIISLSVWRRRCCRLFVRNIPSLEEKIEQIRFNILETERAFHIGPIHQSRESGVFVMDEE